MIFLYICIAVSVFAGDLWIKNRVEKTVEEGETRPLFGGRILLRRHHNRGAILNVGQTRRAVVAAVSAVMAILAALLFLCSLGRRGNALLRTGLAFLLGGAFSNTYDRLKRKYVVDYFSFGVKWKKLRNIIFNLSDFCIMAGALVAALGTMKQ